MSKLVDSRDEVSDSAGVLTVLDVNYGSDDTKRNDKELPYFCHSCKSNVTFSDYVSGQYTQGQLAEKYGIGKSRINEIIKGAMPPDDDSDSWLD